MPARFPAASSARLGLSLGVLLAALTAGSGLQAATKYWTLKPQKDARAPLGLFTVVGGKTAPEGVHFSLPDTSVNAPVVVTLAGNDPGKVLTLTAFKDAPGQALFTGTTDQKGVAICRYRSGETMSFQVSGPAGADYQLSAWVGPEVRMPPPLSVVSMKEVNPTAEVATPVSGTAATASAGGPAAQERDPLVYMLLGGILLVLVVIALLMFRGQKTKASLLFLAFSLGAFSTGTGQQAGGDRVEYNPGLVEPGKEYKGVAESVQSTIDQFKKYAEQLSQLTGGKYDFNTPYDLGSLQERGLRNPKLNVAGVMQAALNFLEAYGIIDPREKFIQPDYNPRGLPALPSRGLDDLANMTPERYGRFFELQERITKAKEHLERNYIVLKQTELKTKRLEELADTAGGFSAIAGLYWANSKADPNDPMNKSKAAFYAKYDEGQQSGLEYLNDALKEFAEFELECYGDRNWYLYFGLPYYHFMSARYVRPGS